MRSVIYTSLLDWELPVVEEVAMIHCFLLLVFVQYASAAVVANHEYDVGSLRQVLVTQGSSIFLTCPNKSSSQANGVVWTKDGVPLTDKPGYTTIHDGGVSRLLISNAKLTNVGLYTCRVFFDDGIDTQNFQLNIMIPVAISLMKPTNISILPPTGSRYVCLNENDDLLPVTQEGKLITNGLHFSDGGEYYCKSMDFSGSSVILNVTVKAFSERNGSLVVAAKSIPKSDTIIISWSSRILPHANSTEKYYVEIESTHMADHELKKRSRKLVTTRRFIQLSGYNDNKNYLVNVYPVSTTGKTLHNSATLHIQKRQVSPSPTNATPAWAIALFVIAFIVVVTCCVSGYFHFWSLAVYLLLRIREKKIKKYLKDNQQQQLNDHVRRFPSDVNTEAYVTLATNTQYCHGAIALGQSLRNTGTGRRLVVMVTNQVSTEMRSRLQALWDEVVVVGEMNSGDDEHLALLRRPELGVTFSKLHAWRLTKYTKCVFLDADTLVLQNVDELFEREEISAAPDVGWPDTFNSGVFVYTPSLITFNNLVQLAKQEGSYDGGDQGLLNTYWSNWSKMDPSHHLPFIYNVVATTSYGYPPAFLRFKDQIKIIHFIGKVKPWHHLYLRDEDRLVLTSSDQCVLIQDYILMWWHVYSSTLPQEDVNSGAILIPHVQSNEERRDAWERGQPDYLGADQFDQIQAHIDAQIESKPA